ncbi:MAG: TolC family protein [Mariniblastus sp.]
MLVVLSLIACAIVSSTGCSRSAYRNWADWDAYRLIRSRQNDERWDLPERVVEPDVRSRMADIQNPDCSPMPPDDPAANCYMQQPYNSKRPISYWNNLGVSDAIDSQHWLQYLPYDESGDVVLDKKLTMDLALLHNREFQSRIEQLHLQALSLSANRFEYDVNWLGGTSTGFSANGDGIAANRDVSQSNRLGLSKNFAAGGQFAANLVNSFTWQLGGNGSSNFSAGNILLTFSQPLLRGAFRHVRTESLTQSERSMLYSVREFARFRRTFYLGIVSDFLDLLTATQSLKIEEENLTNLQRNLEEQQLKLSQGDVSQVQVDQVFQQFQNARVSLINSQQSLETRFDSFKLRLGLPARVPIRLDESILEPFQLNSREVEKLQTDAQELEQSMMKYLPRDKSLLKDDEAGEEQAEDQQSDIAPQEFLDQVRTQIKALSKKLEQIKPEVDSQFEQWKKQLEASKPDDDSSEADKTDHQQQVLQSKDIGEDLRELELMSLAANKQLEESDAAEEKEVDPDAIDFTADIKRDPRVKEWYELRALIANADGLKDRISTLFVSQTRIRLYLIPIKPLKLDQEVAVEIALKNRLDLMNSRAGVTDSFRQVEIAANRLKSDLSVNTSARLATDPNVDNAFRLDSEANQYNLGLEFDGPLNRFGERNSYRAAQIAYQQQRRAYMADEDAIVNGVRLNLRQLQNARFNFQIARQQLITATRQVEQAQINLRTQETAGSAGTRDLLNALDGLRAARNRLISSWISYETSRISIFVDLELLELSEDGIWINDREDLNEFISGGRLQFEESVQPTSQPTINESPFEDSQQIDAPIPDQSGVDALIQPIETSDFQTPQLDTSLFADSGNRFGVLRNILGRN